jgi:hypothetical protein
MLPLGGQIHVATTGRPARAGLFIESSIPAPVDWPPWEPLIQCACMLRTPSKRPALRTSGRISLLAGVSAALLGASVLLAPLPGAAAPPLTLAPEDLRPGDRAIVRSVFRGDSIEEFPAEIVGVLSGGRIDGQTILARATSERLKQVGVAQGMSGSPVYVNGRLIGALASSWAFARDPLFGITPIREMLRLFDQPAAPATGPAGGPAGVELTAIQGGVLR